MPGLLLFRMWRPESRRACQQTSMAAGRERWVLVGPGAGLPFTSHRQGGHAEARTSTDKHRQFTVHTSYTSSRNDLTTQG
eukprot:395016-Prymnesium_polylepis.2